MLTNSNGNNAMDLLDKADSQSSPVRFLVITAASVFIAEAAVMLLLALLPPLPPIQVALIDATLLTALVFPALYFDQFAPLSKQIAERHKAEARLSQSNAMLERLFSITHILLAYMDPKFNFIRVNRAYADADGRSPEEFAGKNHFDLYPNEENERIFRQVIETGEPYFVFAQAFEYAYAPERGTTYWDWSLIPVKESGGRVEGVILSLVDVTERKRAEEETRRRNRQLAALNAISAAASSSLELRPMLNSVKDFLGEQAAFSAGEIYTYDPSHEELQLEVTWGFGGQALPSGYRLPMSELPYRDMTQGTKVSLVSREQMERAGRTAGPATAFPHEWNSCVCVPLVAHGELHGLMELFREDPQELSPAQQGYFQATGQILGMAIYNTRLYAAEQAARQTAETLRQASLALTQSLDLNTVMQALLEFTGRLVPFDSASVILVEDETHLAVYAARGCDCVERLQLGERVIFNRGSNEHLEEVIATRKGKIVANVAPDPAWTLTPCNVGTRSWLGVPFVASQNVIGLCGLAKVQPGFYSDEHLQLAGALASQAAVAVQNAWLFEQLRAGRERLQTLSRQLVEVQENERGYIARELHDEAGQVLTSLMVGLRLLERDAEDPQAVVAGVGELKHMADGVLENLHRLAMDLRPASLDHLGLNAALRQHLEMIADRYHLTVQMETVGLDFRLPGDLEVALYRIVQEALANVVRHAQATRVDVLLERRAGKLVAIIEDNGTGFDEDQALKSGRLGLLGMRERAEMLGGSLDVECGESGGTTISVEVPYGDPDPDCR